jgi:ABC-2 type transport system permease protein
MTLTSLLLRRHRLTLASWLLLLLALGGATVTAYQHTYATDLARRTAVTLAQANAATTLMYGVLSDPGSPAQLYAWEIGTFATVLAAVMAVLVAVSLTRATEDDGTLELARGCGLAPEQPLRSALTVLLACGGLLAAGSTVVVGIHHGGVDAVTRAGAVAYGSVVGLTFLLVATLTTLLAQVAATAGQARVLGFIALGVSFAIRAVADTRAVGWLNWVSPLGLRATVEPFTANRWPALLPPISAVAVLATAAVMLSKRREFGAGLIRRRTTRTSRLRIRSAAGLAVRLAGGSMLTWTAAVAAIGTLFSAMGSGVVDQQRNGAVGGFLGAQLGAGDPAAGYLSYCGTVVGIIVCAYAVLSVSTSWHAERAGLTDLVLATGTRRWAPLAAQAAATGAGCALILATTAALTASIAPSVVGGDDIAARALGYTLGQWPAAAAVIGCTTLLAGTLPRRTVLAWLPVAASAALALLGDLLEVPERVQDLGFFGHVPDVAGAHPSPLALLVLTGLGVAACLAGLAGMARRDVLAG